MASILKQYGVTTVKLDLVKYGKLGEDSRQLGGAHVINGLFDKEPETKKEEIHEHHEDVPDQDGKIIQIYRYRRHYTDRHAAKARVRFDTCC